MVADGSAQAGPGVSSHSSSPLYLQGSSLLNREVGAGLNGLWLMTKKGKRWRISSFVIFLSFFHPSLTGCKWIFCSCYISLGKWAGCVFRWLVIICRVCAQLLHCIPVRPRRPLSFQVRMPTGVLMGKKIAWILVMPKAVTRPVWPHGLWLKQTPGKHHDYLASL